MSQREAVIFVFAFASVQLCNVLMDFDDNVSTWSYKQAIMKDQHSLIHLQIKGSQLDVFSP